MNSSEEKHERLLLHACCAPCTLEPARILSERGYDFDIFYANSNIAPKEEYDLRLDVLRHWAEEQGISLIEGEYDHKSWELACKEPFLKGEISREERCRRCYRLRFEEAAMTAKKMGHDILSTTLSVSPYQYTSVICEELQRACEDEGVVPRFEDFRPFYDSATERSRNAGMYRQNYCGCELSYKEAAEERAERKERRRKEKEERRRANLQDLERDKQALKKRKRERQEYDKERARRKQVLKDIRMRQKTEAANNENG